MALVTGAARGLGAAQVRMLSREGARVVIGDVLEEQGRAVERQIRDAGGDASFVYLDVTLEELWRDAIDITLRSYGTLNVLVNNAGVSSTASIEDMTVTEWDRLMAVNLRGVFLGTKSAIPPMRRAGGGSVVNISSIAGLVGRPGGNAAYAASKGGVRLFTKATAVQHAKDNIRCNSVHPGAVSTDLSSGLMQDPEYARSYRASLPLGRFGTADEIAHAVLFLASDESSFMTGSELVVDGGVTAQ